MVTLLHPWFLLLLAPLAVLAYFTLLRPRLKPLPISSTMLWSPPHQTLTDEPTPISLPERHIDPLWLCIVLSLLFMILTLSGMVFHPTPAPPPAPLPKLQLQMQSLRKSSTTDLFLRATDPHTIFTPLALDILSTGPTGVHSIHQQLLTIAELQKGFTVENIAPAETYAVHLTCISSPTAETLHYTFTAPTTPPLNIITPSFSENIQPLLKFFRLIPQSQFNNPQKSPSLILTHDLPTTVSSSSYPSQAWVIHTPTSSMIPHTPTTVINTAPKSQSTSGLMSNVQLNSVLVHRFLPLSLGADWQVLATINQQPWLAVQTPTHQANRHHLWIASPLTPESTNWPLDPSFVIFLTNVITQIDAGFSPDAVNIYTLSTEHHTTSPPQPVSIPMDDYLTAATLGLCCYSIWLLYKRTCA